MEVVIDAERAVVGRMATYAAKQLLMGNEVAIVNCEKAVVTGPKKALQEVYLNKRTRGGTSQKGPYYSREPEKIVRRAIRGMLPWKRTTGREAFKRVRCYVGLPQEYASKEKMNFSKDLKTPYLTVEQISKLI